MGGARHRGMVQDRLPAFWNGDALVSVDQFEISEADVQSLLDEQCGVILCLVQHAGLLPQYWMLLSPGVLRYGRLFPSLPVWWQLCAPLLVIPEGFSKFVVNYHGAIHRMQHLFLSETVFVSLKSVQQKPSCAS